MHNDILYMLFLIDTNIIAPVNMTGIRHFTFTYARVRYCVITAYTQEKLRLNDTVL